MASSNGPKKSFFTIVEVLNFDFSQFEQLSSPKFTKIQSFESLKLPKMTSLDHLNSPKIDFTQKRSGGKIALTSHFESFWSIVVSGMYFKGPEHSACLYDDNF